jgi:hypothetical protein
MTTLGAATSSSPKGHVYVFETGKKQVVLIEPREEPRRRHGHPGAERPGAFPTGNPPVSARRLGVPHRSRRRSEARMPVFPYRDFGNRRVEGGMASDTWGTVCEHPGGVRSMTRTAARSADPAPAPRRHERDAVGPGLNQLSSDPGKIYKRR